MDTERLFHEIREWASDRDYEPRWAEVEAAFSEQIVKLSKYERRRMHTAYAHWVTRKRIPDHAL